MEGGNRENVNDRVTKFYGNYKLIVLRISTIPSTGNKKTTLWIIIIKLLTISNKENMKINKRNKILYREGQR